MQVQTKIFLICMLALGSLAACTGRVDKPELLYTDGIQKVSAAAFEPTRFASTPTASLLVSQADKALMTPTGLETAPAVVSTSPPLATTSEQSACLSAKGQMIIDSLDSTQLPKPLDYRVYLPPCYDEDLDRRYPVLYMIHGQSYTDEQWDQLGVDEIMDVRVATGELPPFLIVMPRDRVWSQPNEDMFGKVVMEELIPLIDSQYRTLPERQYRAIGGLSRGAGWAVHLGLTEWKTFGALAGHSLAVFHYDARYIRTWLEEIPSEYMPRIYLDIGDKDRPEIMRSALWFENILTEKAVPHEWYLFQGYHDEKYWRTHALQYLRWYAQEWHDIPRG